MKIQTLTMFVSVAMREQSQIFNYTNEASSMYDNS